MSGTPDKAMQEKLNAFAMEESAKVMMAQMMFHLTDVCWEKCTKKQHPEFSSEAQNCFKTCPRSYLRAQAIVRETMSSELNN